MNKPAIRDLDIDVDALAWGRSVADDGYGFEVAFTGPWVLIRAVPGAASGLVSVFSHHEWRCFLDGVAKGEFDDATRRTDRAPGPRLRQHQARRG